MEPAVPVPLVLKVARTGRVLNLSEDGGGSATIDLGREVPQIVDWHAVPFAERYGPGEARFKRRGFARAVVAALAQMGVRQFGITLQSADTVRTMARMMDTGTVQAVPGYEAGPSEAMHPTRFSIGPGPQRPVQLVGPDPAERDLLSGRVQVAPPALAATPRPARAPELDAG